MIQRVLFILGHFGTGDYSMRNLFLSSVALITLAGVANAADMPIKAPVKAVPTDYIWDGFYIGGYYGDAVSQSSVKTPDPTDATNPASQPGEVNVNDHNYTAGVTAGFNWKVSPNFLVGLEGDLGYLGIDRTFKEWNDDIFTGEKADWYGTARARAGYLTGPSLLYVTGGAAFVRTTDTFGGAISGIGGAGPTLLGTASTTTRVGWTAGGGIETKLSRNWSAKTEYLYIDTGTNSFIGNPSAFNTNTTFSHNLHVFKSGVNYNLSGPPEGLAWFNGPMLPSNHNWGGFYAGLNVGGGMSIVQANGVLVNTTPPRGNADINGTGFAGGAQAGYNYMITPKYFVGVEGDIGYLGMQQNVFDWFDLRDNFTLRTSWYGTARVRAGVSTGPALFYVTGGAAWVRLADGFAATRPLFPGDVSWTTASGWTVGGGTEVALDAHWSAKIETLYISTGLRHHNDTIPTAFFADFRERFAIARVGLNYKFGNDVVTARY
jgi:outer membrane immunogenic protein